MILPNALFLSEKIFTIIFIINKPVYIAAPTKWLQMFMAAFVT